MEYSIGVPVFETDKQNILMEKDTGDLQVMSGKRGKTVSARDHGGLRQNSDFQI